MNWLDKLIELKQEYPNRKVLFSIDSDIVADGCYAFWYAKNASVRLDSILDGIKNDQADIYLDHERWYSKSYDDEELIYALYEEYEHYSEDEIDRLFDGLPWEDVIIVSVTV